MQKFIGKLSSSSPHQVNFGMKGESLEFKIQVYGWWIGLINFLIFITGILLEGISLENYFLTEQILLLGIEKVQRKVAGSIQINCIV